MMVNNIQELPIRAKNSLISNGYETLKDINEADFYDIFALYAFKSTPENMKILTEIMHKNGYPKWGLTPLLYDKTITITSEEK